VSCVLTHSCLLCRPVCTHRCQMPTPRRLVQDPSASRTLDLPFEAITLAFKDLSYFVPNPTGTGEIQLLKDVMGAFRPGILTALMGESGAGKTTLMDVLADRKTAGRQEGVIKGACPVGCREIPREQPMHHIHQAAP
jgi:ABC-type glutathione transport system ATPase component